MFSNTYLDKFLSDPDNYLSDLRTFGASLSQQQTAHLLGLSKATIRRYESSTWNKCKVPDWYGILLRFLSGDLSYFGNYWTNTRINPADKKLSSDYFPHLRMVPSEMHINHNKIYRMAQQEIKEMQHELNKVNEQNKILLMRNAELELDIEKLKGINDRLRAHDNAVKSGKVINIFGS